MIASLRGTILSKTPETVVIESAGVGREIHVTPMTASTLPEIGSEAFLHILPSYAMYGGGETLYGFLGDADREMFRAFRDEVPGTGAKKALEYLEKASKSLPDFRRAILERDEKLLCGVFGFTRKTAAKIIESLKGKIEEFRAPGTPRLQRVGDAIPPTGSWSQALHALEALGYRPAEVRAALQVLAEEHGGKDFPAEQLVRQALKKL